VGRPYTGPWPSPAAMRWLAGTDAAARPVPGVPAGAPTGVLPDTSAVSYTDDPAAFAAQVAAARACPDRGLSWRDGTTAPVLTGYGRGRSFATELEYDAHPGADPARVRDAVGAALAAQGLGTGQLSGHSSAEDHGYHGWFHERENTVTGGEVVPPVLADHPTDWAALPAALDAIAHGGGIASRRTGEHVNISAPDFRDPRPLLRLHQLWAAYHRELQILARAGHGRDIPPEPVWVKHSWRGSRLEFRLFDAAGHPGRSQALIVLAAALIGYASATAGADPLPARTPAPPPTAPSAPALPAIPAPDGPGFAAATVGIRELIDLVATTDTDKHLLAALWAYGAYPAQPGGSGGGGGVRPAPRPRPGAGGGSAGADVGPDRQHTDWRTTAAAGADRYQSDVHQAQGARGLSGVSSVGPGEPSPLAGALVGAVPGRGPPVPVGTPDSGPPVGGPLAVSVRGETVSFSSSEHAVAQQLIAQAFSQPGRVGVLDDAAQAALDPTGIWAGHPVVIVTELTAGSAWASADKALLMWVEHGTLYLDAGVYTRLRVMGQSEIDRILLREYIVRVLGQVFDDALLPGPDRLRWLAGLDAAAGRLPVLPAAVTGPLGFSTVDYRSNLAGFAADVVAALRRRDGGMPWRDEAVLVGYGRGRLFSPHWSYDAAGLPIPGLGPLTVGTVAAELARAGLIPGRVVHRGSQDGDNHRDWSAWRHESRSEPAPSLGAYWTGTVLAPVLSDHPADWWALRAAIEATEFGGGVEQQGRITISVPDFVGNPRRILRLNDLVERYHHQLPSSFRVEVQDSVQGPRVRYYHEVHEAHRAVPGPGPGPGGAVLGADRVRRGHHGRPAAAAGLVHGCAAGHHALARGHRGLRPPHPPGAGADRSDRDHQHRQTAHRRAMGPPRLRTRAGRRDRAARAPPRPTGPRATPTEHAGAVGGHRGRVAGAVQPGRDGRGPG